VSEKIKRNKRTRALVADWKERAGITAEPDIFVYERPSDNPNDGPELLEITEVSWDSGQRYATIDIRPGHKFDISYGDFEACHYHKVGILTIPDELLTYLGKHFKS
jgi:hypothetical protein